MIWPVSPVPGELPAGYKFGAPRTTGSSPHSHGGVDIGVGGRPVYAAEGGTVSFTGWSQGIGGLMVYIKHAGGSETRYMHLTDGSIKVKKGQTVSAGQQIATVGRTGISNSAAHLHFEILQNGIRIDPESVLRGGGLLSIALLASVAWVVYKTVM